MNELEKLTIDAEADDIDSQIELGIIYMYGDEGIRKNTKKAIYFLTKAAKQNSGDAYNYLSDIFHEKIPNEDTQNENYKFVIDYLKKAIALNHLPSINALGHLYRLGHGVNQNYAKALELFKKGAALGSAACMNDVANCYISGWGVEINDLEATIWLKKAADLGHGSAGMFLGAEPYRTLVNGIET